LLPVNWVAGWPIIGKVGADTIGTMVWSGKKPIITKIQNYQDKQMSLFPKTLSPDWEWNYQPRASKWSLSARKGHLRLYAFQPINPQDTIDILLRAGNTLTQRSLRTQECTVTIKVDIANMSDGQQAGLTHFSTTSIANINKTKRK
jgi:beta-xylosidase